MKTKPEGLESRSGSLTCAGERRRLEKPERAAAVFGLRSMTGKRNPISRTDRKTQSAAASLSVPKHLAHEDD